MQRIIATLLLAASSITAAAQGAADYPSAPVRIVVPFQAGGLTDILARAIAQHASQRLGQPFVVENKPGASGNIGADTVAKSRPDGLTLLMGSIGTNAVNAHLFSRMPYDTLKDFSPISLVANGTLMLVTNPSVPATDMRSLLAYARAHPGQLTYASGGAGASQHLAGELLKTMAKVDIVHVPYKGVVQGVTDVVAGQVHMTFDLATVEPHIRAGKLRPIAVANARRSSAFPEVPTIAEAGVPGYEVSAWYGLFAPAGTSRAIVDKLNAEVVSALKDPALLQRLKALGAEPAGSTPEELQRFVRREYDKWGKVVQQAGIRLD
ncbi:Bug family tripartite tricarboxylate transporter substrate binding protein [Hydrogenophaga sp. BPS33]|uniref:Bug family tripartite tricarboxylate transporter substrate binding protein n=1 Tax=Hydrogenophaga sp. BPS33 TaxID=2651974 RepID=UPI00132030CE|nr:tripartite tricarboxylate transporter substrate binding protein [Hydrogenophaga sp. BPS33]QHE83658.1 tripartite tricarboxylate transporter substrate binding protein [Hydrogenophaga sp. BPS33]